MKRDIVIYHNDMVSRGSAEGGRCRSDWRMSNAHRRLTRGKVLLGTMLIRQRLTLA